MKLFRVIPVTAAVLLFSASLSVAEAREMDSNSTDASAGGSGSMDQEIRQPTPSPTNLTPLPTMPEMSPTPAPTQMSTSPTPAPTMVDKHSTHEGTPHGSSSCVEVSVEHDATFCIDGPVCSGDADNEPAGTVCPRVGDVAVASCLDTAPSYSSEQSKCVAPVEAQCRVIASGAWGCVWDLPVPMASTNGSDVGDEEVTPSPTSMTEGTPAPTNLEATPAPTSPSTDSPSPTSAATPSPTSGSDTADSSAADDAGSMVTPAPTQNEVTPSPTSMPEYMSDASTSGSFDSYSVTTRSVSLSAATPAGLSSGATVGVVLAAVAAFGAVAAIAVVFWRKKRESGANEGPLTAKQHAGDMVVTPSSTPASSNNFHQV